MQVPELQALCNTLYQSVCAIEFGLYETFWLDIANPWSGNPSESILVLLSNFARANCKKRFLHVSDDKNLVLAKCR